MREELKPPLELLEHHSTIVLRGSREPLISPLSCQETPFPRSNFSHQVLALDGKFEGGATSPGLEFPSSAVREARTYLLNDAPLNPSDAESRDVFEGGVPRGILIVQPWLSLSADPLGRAARFLIRTNSSSLEISPQSLRLQSSAGWPWPFTLQSFTEAGWPFTEEYGRTDNIIYRQAEPTFRV